MLYPGWSLLRTLGGSRFTALPAWLFTLARPAGCSSELSIGSINAILLRLRLPRLHRTHLEASARRCQWMRLEVAFIAFLVRAWKEHEFVVRGDALNT